jgi:hypothetical protein
MRGILQPIIYSVVSMAVKRRAKWNLAITNTLFLMVGIA